MSTLSEIRKAVAERIETIGIRARHVPAGDFTGNDLPVAILTVANGNYARTFGGQPLDGQIVVTLIVRKGEAEEGYEELDQYLSRDEDKSIANAIEEELTAGLPDVTLAVMGFQNAGFRDEAGGVWAADIIVNYAKRS